MLKTASLALALALALILGPAGPAPAQTGDQAYVSLATNLGEIVLELDRQAAPNTVDNFVQYVKDGHYDGTIFHRVIGTFMIQGGGLDSQMKERPTRAPIRNEAKNGLSNAKYTVAMARTSDPHSATAQFFINTNDNKPLDFTEESGGGWGYAVFGKVVKGQSVVDAIAKSKTGRLGMYDDVPVKPVVIEKATLLSGPPQK